LKKHHPQTPPPQDFFEDVFEELDKFGEIEKLNVCDNLADHLVGNVYVKFRDEEDAARALTALQARRGRRGRDGVGGTGGSGVGGVCSGCSGSGNAGRAGAAQQATADRAQSSTSQPLPNTRCPPNHHHKIDHRGGTTPAAR